MPGQMTVNGDGSSARLSAAVTEVPSVKGDLGTARDLSDDRRTAEQLVFSRAFPDCSVGEHASCPAVRAEQSRSRAVHFSIIGLQVRQWLEINQRVFICKW